MKTCTKCGEVKPLDEFWKDKRAKNGVLGACKKCRYEILKKYRSENKEKMNEWQKKYNSENQEKVKEINKKYYYKNKEKVKERQRKNRSENPEKVKKIKKKYYYKNKEKINELLRKNRSENQEEVLFNDQKRRLKKQIGETPPSELVEIKVLINKTKRLCKTLKN